MLRFFVALLFFTASASPQSSPRSETPCLLVRPTQGYNWAMGPVPGLSGNKYEYLDSVHLPSSKMTYKKKDLEKLQAHGVHVVVVQRDAKRDEVKQARESCSDTK